MIGCFLVSLVLLQSRPLYAVRVLGSANGQPLMACGLNDAGAVTGYCGPAKKSGFRLVGSKLDLFGNGNGDSGRMIDSDGDVVGTTGAGGFLWTEGGGLQVLQVMAGRKFDPRAISPNGIVAGTLYPQLGVPEVGLWQVSTGYQSLPLPFLTDPSHGSIAVEAVNSSGMVAADYFHGSDVVPLRLSSKGVSAVLPVAPEAHRVFVRCINSAGWIGGQGSLWNPQGIRVDVGPRVDIRGINDQIVAVGQRFEGPGNVAIIWDGVNGLRDLNALISTVGVKLEEAVAINNRGQIACVGKLYDKPQSFLLTPIRE